MKTFKSVEELLDFAIAEEVAAADFYRGLADKMESEWMKKAFHDFAREEMGHKAKLEAIKRGGKLKASEGKILDLKIAEYVVDSAPTPEMDYSQALILAMKKEKASFKMYLDLAQSVDDLDLYETLMALAREEAQHKVRFEIEYDDEVLSEN